MGIKKWVVVIAGIGIAGLIYAFYNVNDFRRTGELRLQGLQDRVVVARDEKGMAHIRAQSQEDLFFSQGFVTAQDRYFSMEMIRRVVRGRLSEVLGGSFRKTDIRLRTIGFYRNAGKHEALLDPEERALFQRYVDGINAFIRQTPGDIHLKIGLAGITPEEWEVADVLGIIYYMGWGSSANLSDEVVAQMLIEKLGVARARELFPLNFNPDEPDGKPLRSFFNAAGTLGAAQAELAALLPSDTEGSLGVGSNNWVTDARLSASGKPVLANDPHLRTRTIPGPLYPMGLTAPGIKAVGVNVPGIPAMIAGRTASIAMGVTNGYGDIQDLYVETPDPDNADHYLEGSRSVPFDIIRETLRIKDKDAPGGFREETVVIRLTRRGPVVSPVLEDLDSPRLFSLRWAPFESMGPRVGFFDLIRSRDIHEARQALSRVNGIMLNFVLADTGGNIAWQTVGRIPVRSQADATVPYVVRDGRDNWTGWIPWEEMPKQINPDAGWTGTCNHTTVTNDYPYYFSYHFSPSWRQRRLMELMAAPGKKTPRDHWAFQRDTRNLMAERIVPIMVPALAADERTRPLAGILSDWDYSDNTGLVAPTVFQQVFREFYFLTFRDDLGPGLAMLMGKNYYFWQERLVDMMTKGASPWFDDVSTPGVREGLQDGLVSAGIKADEALTARFGPDRTRWTWGRVHTKEFVSPVRQKGLGKDLLGGGTHPMAGSVETLYRAYYKFDTPYRADITAAMRMVVDFGDPDKILAVMPCGVSERFFSAHRTDQIEAFMNGDEMYWWFSEAEIERHTRTRLFLIP